MVKDVADRQHSEVGFSLFFFFPFSLFFSSLPAGLSAVDEIEGIIDGVGVESVSHGDSKIRPFASSPPSGRHFSLFSSLFPFPPFKKVADVVRVEMSDGKIASSEQLFRFSGQRGWDPPFFPSFLSLFFFFLPPSLPL